MRIIFLIFLLSVFFTFSVKADQMQITFGATNFPPGAKKEEIIAHYNSIQAQIFKEIGATSFESYVRWSAIEREENKWDFSIYDLEVECLKKYNLKWVPFLIAGPAYTTPDWFKNSEKSLFYKCIEHNKESEVQSIWNPHLKKYIERFIKKFAEHYANTGIIESILVGITGDFGEAIYPVTGGGWTGNYHQHEGFWCADKYAIKDFQNYLKKKYKRIENLNKKWQMNFRNFEEISPSIFKNSSSSQHLLEQIEWYRDTMNKWIEFWLKTVKKYFPNTSVYLCTGGDGYPPQGSDFSKQVKIAAKYNCGVRITNEGSDYPVNFVLTRWIASSGKFYKTFYGFEPASFVSKEGLINRIYNATSSGAIQLFEYSNNITQDEERKNIFRENVKFLLKREPIVKIAAFIPTTYLTLNYENRWRNFFQNLAKLREISDFDFLDENLIEDGALKNYEVLFITEGDLLREKTKDKIISFIKKGGILFGHKLSEIKTLDGNFLLPEEIREKIRPEKETSLKDSLKFENGYILSTIKRATTDKFKKTLSEIVYNTDKIDKKYSPLSSFNKEGEGIYITYFKKGILILNTLQSSIRYLEF